MPHSTKDEYREQYVMETQPMWSGGGEMEVTKKAE